MKKNIPIILKKNINNLGKTGNIVNVKRGYAFNYLIPNRMGELATKGLLKHNNMLLDIKSKQIEKNKIEALVLKNKLETIAKISLKKKIGKDQQIFGSLNDKEILLKIEKCSDIKLEKKQISIPEIKKIGSYSIDIQISDIITANLKLQILPQDI
uniref:50S ribosomal protein L9, chloroplastic n=1 Tax=Sebdenia flabellata TaxID=42024 RepID=A0A1C9CA58_9FLOR|nr:ribosomal protein L9 [Sebdenia flabellata]AOM65249.1 ribosomal protein L9 [Sebdenia flabellata]